MLRFDWRVKSERLFSQIVEKTLYLNVGKKCQHVGNMFPLRHAPHNEIPIRNSLSVDI